MMTGASAVDVDASTGGDGALTSDIGSSTGGISASTIRPVG
jgi:hypothetical protein